MMKILIVLCFESIGDSKMQKKFKNRLILCMCTFKGTVTQDFLLWFFFIKQLLLVRLDMPRKDLEFCRIFKELFAVVIDSPLHLPPGSRGSLVYSPPWSWGVDLN